MSADPCGCGCCEPPVAPAPAAIFNVPGLPAIGYRIGTYGGFREALIEAMARDLALRELTTRDDSDYAIALLDSWAYLADVLTFYSERTINEAFLRTARLRDSIVRLAEMVGYDPSPGLAATAPLAFLLDAAARFTLAAGARVQSVPAAGATTPPVTFETLADLEADGALSRVALVAPPAAHAPLAAGSPGGSLPPGAQPAPGLVPGATLLAWSPDSASVERKQLDVVTDAGTLAWSPPLQHAQTRMTLWRRDLRLFGHDAPPSFLALNPSTSPPTPKLTDSPDFGVPAGTTLDLDRALADLAVGSRLLISSATPPGVTRERSVTAVTSVAVTFGPLQATVTRVTVDEALPALGDRRAVAVAEVGAGVKLWTRRLPEMIPDGVVYAPVAAASAPARNRTVILTDGSGAPTETAVVSAVPAPDLPGHLAITVSPPPAAPLDAATALLFGNVARASEGKAVADELLGRGDATLPFQRFALGKPPLTRVPHSGAPHGGRSTLVVRVGGLQWHERERLYGAAPDDRVFVVTVDDDGAHWVVFGDGVQGARLPTGAEITAGYRSGLGTEGNVGAGALSSPLTRPKGLLSVTNPVAAAGGADPERAEEARANAPNTVRTFDRIVSLRDVEDQARSNALVAKAHAVFMPVGPDLGVGLTVAGPAGALLTGDQLADLQADLDARRDPNQRLVIRGYRPVALAVSVRLIAIHPDVRPDDARDNVTAALLAHFALEARAFGQPVHVSEAFVAAQAAGGVLGIDVEVLTLADPAQLAPHGLSGAPVHERIDLAPDELATLAVADLVVTGP
jgi:predicted phage baseplate assembly protein